MLSHPAWSRLGAWVVVVASALASPLALAESSKKSEPKGAPEKKQATEAQKLSESFARAFQRVSPSLAQIEAIVADDKDKDEESGGRLVATGVIVDENGLILTSNRVVERALSLVVRLRDGRVFEARLAGRDPTSDLAVLRIDARKLPAARFAAGSGASVGDWVVAAAWPSGVSPVMASGVVGATGTQGLGGGAVEDALLADAHLAVSGEGSPLVNLDGEIEGIVSTALSRKAGRTAGATGGTAKRVATALAARGKVERASAGASWQEVSPALAEELGVAAGQGALLGQVTSGGPAAKANLKAGDVVVALEGQALRSGRDLTVAVLGSAPGASLALEVLRGGKRYATTLVLGARQETLPAIPAQTRAPARGLGLVVRDLPATEGASGGSVIEGVTAGSAADRAGLQAGDRVLEADGTSQPSAAQVQQSARDGKLLLRVKRREEVRYVVVR